jgi:hypothetical protein
MSSPTPPGPPQNQPPQYPPQQQYPPQYQQPQYQQPYQQQAPVAKKTSPWVWVAVAVVGIIFLGAAAIGVGTYFLYRTVKNAGFDPALMKSNPGLAMAKMAAAVNPDLESVSSDDRNGTITMREKSTGKTVTFRFDTEKKSLVVVGDDGKEVKFSASGDDKTGALTIQGPDGTVKFGASAGNNAPAWVPVYPGSSAQGSFSSQTGDGNQNTFSFKTNDSSEKVLTYYQDKLKSGGFNLDSSTTYDTGGLIHAEDRDKQRTIVVTVTSSPAGTEGSVTAVEKK